MMNQCVPSWDLGGNPTPRLALRTNSNSNSNSVTAADVPTLDYEVAELTWENGQLAMHGLGPPRLLTKQLPTGGTLESIVNQATTAPAKGKSVIGTGNELVPWFEEQRRAVTSAATASASMTLTMDALVPCSNPAGNSMAAAGMNTCMVGCSTRVGSCNDKVREARVPHEWSSRPAASVSGSATWGFDSRQLTLDTFEKEREFCTATGFTSTSMGSQGNTSSDKQYTKTLDEHDSVCHSRNQREAGDEADKKKGSGKLSVSTKRSRAAAIHNQSERKRRDKINQRMKTLQKLVPNSSKTDKASMLDEVIEYLKQLQGQVNMMSRMNMSPMMLPLAMQQQQLQMSMMAPMMNLAGMGLGVMDINAAMASRPNIAGIPPAFNPAAFLPGALTSWDGSGDRLASSSSAMPDPLSAFLACQSPPMTMDAYSRMAALYQQFQQPSGPASKGKQM